jgi:hypothetical protein
MYDNYLIPKGSTVFMSVWTMHQNDQVYSDAEQFKPERYLSHPKMANEYATSADYENRGESALENRLRRCTHECLQIITATDLADACVQGYTWPSATCGGSRQS